MNKPKWSLLGGILLAVAAGPAAAQAPAGPALSRAEVLADLQLWQQSGMAAFTDGEASADSTNPAYRAAQSRYLAMRASPEFEPLVARIARERGEPR